MAPGKKQLRKIYKTKRRQLGKSTLVVPNNWLAKIIGPEKRAQSEVINKIWEYIRGHKLLHDEQVEADANLLPIFLGRRVVRKKDIKRYVLLNVRPSAKEFGRRVKVYGSQVSGIAVRISRFDRSFSGQIAGESYSLPGKSSTDLPGPDPEKDEREEEAEV
jgi:hypothetical protein